MQEPTNNNQNSTNNASSTIINVPKCTRKGTVNAKQVIECMSIPAKSFDPQTIENQLLKPEPSRPIKTQTDRIRHKHIEFRPPQDLNCFHKIAHPNKVVITPYHFELKDDVVDFVAAIQTNILGES